ncbi:uncharacterized protein LOC116237308 [Phasianus colchicus]|uniref:uncharacterized protein LOC116237308 n=1 Tax=Phasianus colchicus TaxID=9054 RepID=UPI00129DEB56|nr:uncharacterized protein LOC116237308 [Phasianus colchicus]
MAAVRRPWSGAGAAPAECRWTPIAPPRPEPGGRGGGGPDDGGDAVAPPAPHHPPPPAASIHLSIHPSIRPSVRPFTHPSVRPPARPPAVRPFVCPSALLSFLRSASAPHRPAPLRRGSFDLGRGRKAQSGRVHNGNCLYGGGGSKKEILQSSRQQRVLCYPRGGGTDAGRGAAGGWDPPTGAGGARGWAQR